MILTNTNTIDAVIYLKDGKRKYGMIMEESPETNNYMFVPNNHVSHFVETQSDEYVEIVPGILIEAIETDLK